MGNKMISDNSHKCIVITCFKFECLLFKKKALILIDFNDQKIYSAKNITEIDKNNQHF